MDTNFNLHFFFHKTYIYVVQSNKKGYGRKIILTFLKRAKQPMRVKRDEINFHKMYGYYRLGASIDSLAYTFGECT